MNKKLNVLFFILILTLFVHGGVYAEEENSSDKNNPVASESSQNSPTNEKVLTKDQSTEDASKDPVSVEVQNASDHESTGEAANTSEAVEKSDSLENSQVADNFEGTENSDSRKDLKVADNSEAPSENKVAENNPETTEVQTEGGESENPTGETNEPGTPEEKPAGEAPEENTSEKTDEEKPADETGETKENSNPEDTGNPEEEKDPEATAEDPKQEVDTNNKDLADLAKKIESEKDPAKKAELQKEYNQKYLDALGSSEKLDKEILNRFTDEERTKEYYRLKDEYESLKAQAAREDLKAEDLEKIKDKLDVLNKELGNFKVPRILDTDEKSAAEELSKSPTIGIKDTSTDEGKRIYDEYLAAKDALNKAIDAENTDEKSKDFDQLLEDFRKAEKAFKKALADKKIDPKYTNGTPELRLYPLDSSGKVGNELEEDTYYIPDKTPLDLLVQVNKDKSDKKFKFTIKTLGDEGVNLPEASLSNLAFLNGNPVELVKNEDGSYSFTTSPDQDFGVAQIRFNMPGFKAAFHKGFSITMSADGAKDVTKKFLITKKGYEDDADVSGLGNKDKENPQKDVNAGETQDGYVKEDTDKVFDFFSYLKKSNAHINEVLVNSANGESLPLSSVDVTITLPEYNGKIAEIIHKSGLKYHNLGEGKYQLKLDMKTFQGNENFKVEDGKLLYKGEELKAENISNAILEGKEGKNMLMKREKNMMS